MISRWCVFGFFFFFQAEDGIRDDLVTGVQTCALPILGGSCIATSKRVRRNEEISAPSVRVIAADGSQAGVMTRPEALQMALSQTLDLVEVSPMADPPLVRVMDFGKFLFEQNNKAHAANRNQKHIQV